VEINKHLVVNRVPPRVSNTFDDFRSCGDCGRIYWKGTHYRNMKKLVDTLWAPRAEEEPASMVSGLFGPTVARPEKVGLQ
jgi:uncharacterized protein with PIN domain